MVIKLCIIEDVNNLNKPQKVSMLGADKSDLILIILFLLLKTQNCMFLLSLYQQRTTKNYQKFLAKDLKDQCVGMNIKQDVRIKMQQIKIEIFLNQTL